MKNNTGMNNAANDDVKIRWSKPKRPSFFDFLKCLENDPIFNKFYNSNFVEQPKPDPIENEKKESEKPKTSPLKESLNKQIKSGNGYILQKMVLEKDWSKLKFILEDNHELCKWLSKQPFDWFFELPSDILELINNQL